MEAIRHKSNLHGKSKLARTFQKVCNLRSSSRISSNNGGIGICMLTSQNPNFDEEDDDGDSVFDQKSTRSGHSDTTAASARHKAVLEAVLAKIFASVTSIKAAYAELQMAQRPYNSAAIQEADQAVVGELKSLSELKRRVLKKDLNLSPQVSLMLSEIQEQQSLMRTYEITIKKLESEAKEKESSIDSLKKQLDETVSSNKSMEKKLNASGSLSLFDNINFRTLNLSHFVQILNLAVRSIRSFVKLMVREMEAAQWDLDAAARAIEGGSGTDAVVFAKPSHRCFAFESFVSKTMLEGFDSPSFSVCDANPVRPNREQFFNRFKNLRSVEPSQYLHRNPSSSFARFMRLKYLNVVHAKMECSFFGNLNQRKLINSGEFPDTCFFAGFAEMAKRVWLLQCLAFALNDRVEVFQVRKGCRFSEVYMENVIRDDSLLSHENADFPVSFTVVPGFRIGDAVIQSQVYSSPAS